MPNQISFAIPCESQWIEGIYQLECSDLLSGYDPETGVDGVSNQQAKELGDRTLYLRDLLNADHANGHHSLENADFDDATKIPESALKLDHSTQDLHDAIEAVKNDTARGNETISSLTDVNLSYTSVLTVLMPYSREYFRTHADYELFTDRITLRNYGYTHISREIAGDDSLDVEDATGIEAGKTYFLMNIDGTDVEEVVVLSVLNDNRVRLTSDLVHTRSSGYLATSTLIPQEGKATVNSGFVYTTGIIDTLVDAESGKLFIHRDNVAADSVVRYCMDGSDTWRVAERLGQELFYDGSIDDIFALPAGKLKLRIEYSDSADRFNLYYFVVKAIWNYIAIENIRRPEISSVSLTGNVLTVTGGPYASLWQIPQDHSEARVIDASDDYHVVKASGVGVSTSVAVALPSSVLNARPLYAQLRYVDVEGTGSRWSKSYIVE